MSGKNCVFQRNNEKNMFFDMSCWIFKKKKKPLKQDDRVQLASMANAIQVVVLTLDASDHTTFPTTSREPSTKKQFM